MHILTFKTLWWLHFFSNTHLNSSGDPSVSKDTKYVWLNVGEMVFKVLHETSTISSSDGMVQPPTVL